MCLEAENCQTCDISMLKMSCSIFPQKLSITFFSLIRKSEGLYREVFPTKHGTMTPSGEPDLTHELLRAKAR